jgi:uncharacterized protein
LSFESKHPLPVFPLSGVVLFPGAQLPLHVFEVSHRTMVREALSAQRVIAVALLRPGWEHDDLGCAEYFPLGCLARIDDVAWLPDDCYNLQIHGLARARLGRSVREFPYRAVSTEVLPQEPFSEDDPLVQLERQALIQAGARLARQTAPEGEAAATVGEDLGFEALVNTLCMRLDAEPIDKMALLEMDSVIERARRARELMEWQLRRAEAGGTAGGESN